MKQPDFIIIPTQLLSDKNLQPADRILFGYIYWMTKLALMKCVASNETFEELTGFGERTVSKSLQRLENNGFVRIIYKDSSRRHRVEIQTLIAFNAVNESRPNTRSIQTEHTDGLDRTGAHHNKKDIIRTLNKNKVSKDTLVKTDNRKPEINKLFDYWTQATGLEITSRLQPNRFAASNLLKKHGVEKMRQLIDGVVLAQGDQYAPRIADFCDLQAKLNQLIVWGRKRNQSNVEVI